MLVKVSTPEAIGCAAPCHTRGLLRCSYSYLVCMTTTLLLQLLPGVSYAAAVNCCHNTYQRNTCHRPDCGERAAPCQRILPRPLPPLRSQNQCTTVVQQSVTGRRAQSNPSAHFAIDYNPHRERGKISMILLTGYDMRNTKKESSHQPKKRLDILMSCHNIAWGARACRPAWIS